MFDLVAARGNDWPVNRVEVVYVNSDGSEQRREVLTIEARELAMETLGLSLSEGKALLAGVQDVVVAVCDG